MVKNEFGCLCHLCFPNAKEYCELLPGCWLFENEGQFGLMCEPGHDVEDAILMFPRKPTPDTDPECENESDNWIDVVCDWEPSVVMHPEDGHFLVEACKESGWDGSNSMLQWLYDFAGRKLAQGEQYGIQ